ncbi:MAG: hypothetical protein AAFS10_05315, partial [Myxococcota bacterium]
LDPDALNRLEQDTILSLPCGRYLLNRIAGGIHLIRLQIQGRVALYVDGDIELDRQLALTFDGPGAELDLFVAGRLISAGTLQLGERENTQALRIYVGGPGPLELSGILDLAGHLYAPNSELALNGNAEVFGSIQVQQMTLSGSLTLFYDPTAQELECGP